MCWTLAAIGAGALWNAFSHSTFGFDPGPSFAYLFTGGIACGIAVVTTLVVAVFRSAGGGFVVALHVAVAAGSGIDGGCLRWDGRCFELVISFCRKACARWQRSL